MRYSGAVLPSDRPFIVLDSVLCGSDDDAHIECLLLHVETDGRKEAEGDTKRTPSFMTHLTWLSLMPGRTVRGGGREREGGREGRRDGGTEGGREGDTNRTRPSWHLRACFYRYMTLYNCTLKINYDKAVTFCMMWRLGTKTLIFG